MSLCVKNAMVRDWEHYLRYTNNYVLIKKTCKKHIRVEKEKILLSIKLHIKILQKYPTKPSYFLIYLK